MGRPTTAVTSARRARRAKGPNSVPLCFCRPYASKGFTTDTPALVAMRAAGFVVTRPDPVDGRRMLYSLAPSVPLTKTETGKVMDFGFCLLRV